MRFLKFRYIFTLAIVLVLGITLMVYFFGGLNATALENSNLEFTYEGYIDYNGYDDKGVRYVVYETEAEMNAALVGVDPDTYIISSESIEQGVYLVSYYLSSERIVAQNEKYTMFLDELTTIITVGENQTAEPTTEKTRDGFINYDLSTFTKTYQSALDVTNRLGSNFLLYYVGSNGKETSAPYNSMSHSVRYEDKLLNEYQRHYQIKFDVENGIEILYEVGDFTIFDSFFPDYLTREDIYDFFVGNLVFQLDATSVSRENLFKYASAYTFSQECADYLEERELAVVTPNYGPIKFYDEEGEAVVQRYDLTEILAEDEDGNPLNRLKMKIGVDYNAADINAENASPCIANPYANSFTLGNFFGAYYKLESALSDELLEQLGIEKEDEDEELSFQINWQYNHPELSPLLKDSMSGHLQYIKQYDYMYRAHTADSPNDFYNVINEVPISIDNYEQYVSQYPGITIGDKITTKVPVSYFEDLSTLVKGYYQGGKFYAERSEDTPYKYSNLITADPDMNYISLDSSKTFRWDEELERYIETNFAVPMGGRQARDEDGNFLFDEDGNPVQEVYTVEMANYQNEKFGVSGEVFPPIFQLAMRFVLTDEGFETTILNNSFLEGKGVDYTENGSKTKYSHDLQISKIDILPYMTSNNDPDSEGQIILPDGSGAIVSFNSPKAALGYTSPIKRVYGPDKAFVFEQIEDENENLMFGMYGFLDKTEEKGYLGIVDKGAAQTEIRAEYKRGDTTRNLAHFTSIIRESETVHVGSNRAPFDKWSRERSQTDLSYSYQFLDKEEFISDGELQYVGLAHRYRNYLIDKYDLEVKDTTNDNVVVLNFLGAIEKREVRLGFGRDVEHSLTTFDQAQSIIEELQNEGIKEFAVVYKGWTRDAMETRATNNVKVSKALGNAKGIKSFSQFLEEQAIGFYPEISVTSNRGYDYSFGNLKYTAKSVGSTYAQHPDYDVATRRASRSQLTTTMLSPVFYVDYLNRYLKSYNKIGINSGLFSDLGNTKLGDYSRKRVTYPDVGKEQQRASLDIANEELDSIMLAAPFDYALEYTDIAIDVPLDFTALGYYDYSIPFYQLVVAGLFDYTGPAVNLDGEMNANWYLLKALETGSNLQFIISAQDTEILLESDYTMYQRAYYINLKNDIVRMNKTINDTGIHNNGYLVSHKILSDNVYEVLYSNGVQLVINYTNSTFYDHRSGLSVAPNRFVVIQEGRA